MFSFTNVISDKPQIIIKGVFFKKNGPTPASFSFIFGLFKQTLQFLQQINVKNIRRESNPQPLLCESLHITTRPGLPPKLKVFWDEIKIDFGT